MHAPMRMQLHPCHVYYRYSYLDRVVQRDPGLVMSSARAETTEKHFSHAAPDNNSEDPPDVEAHCHEPVISPGWAETALRNSHQEVMDQRLQCLQHPSRNIHTRSPRPRPSTPSLREHLDPHRPGQMRHLVRLGLFRVERLAISAHRRHVALLLVCRSSTCSTLLIERDCRDFI